MRKISLVKKVATETKKNAEPQQVTAEDCAERLKAIADPDRLRIVSFLQLGSFSVGDLASELDMELANVSHHLGVLKNSGIVFSEKQGRSRIYHLRPEYVASKSNGLFDFGCCRFELKDDWKSKG